jgi:hypothetical protein
MPMRSARSLPWLRNSCNFCLIANNVSIYAQAHRQFGAMVQFHRRDRTGELAARDVDGGIVFLVIAEPDDAQSSVP